jgi:hypothetical protein
MPPAMSAARRPPCRHRISFRPPLPHVGTCLRSTAEEFGRTHRTSALHSSPLRGGPTGLFFLKLFEKIYAPLTAGIIEPIAADKRMPIEKTSSLDRRYTAVVEALDHLVEAVGLKAA